MTMLGHIKQLFTYSHRLDRLRFHDWISLHDKYRSILLDLIFRGLRELKKDIAIAFMDSTIDLNKRIQCANPLYRSLKCLFIFFATTTTTLLSYTRPWTATFFDVFRLICISWIWIKQSPWGFHRIRPDTRS